MCHVSFLSFFGTTDVKNYLHICIVLFEVSRAIFSTYFSLLCSDDAVICFDIV